MRIYKEFTNGENPSIVARRLLKKAIFECYSVSDFEISYNQNGKPLTDCCFFSIAHKKEIAICAVCDKQIGIDIENIKPIKKRKGYFLFSEDENEYVNSFEDISVPYLTIFTMKEAYVKLYGIRLCDSEKISFVKNGKLITDFDDFYLKTTTENGYIITVAEGK